MVDYPVSLFNGKPTNQAKLCGDDIARVSPVIIRDEIFLFRLTAVRQREGFCDK